MKELVNWINVHITDLNVFKWRSGHVCLMEIFRGGNLKV